MALNRNLPPVHVSQFSMVPRGDVPRSTFGTQHAYKTTFHTGYLIPFHVDEVLPGDVHQGRVTIFARLAALLFPVMDNVWLETFFFFVPARLLWNNWTKFMGERVNPSDSISYVIPQCVSAAGGFPVNSIYDYFGLPVVGGTVAGTVSVNSLPLRAYSLIWNEWFRDQDLQNSLPVPKGDGPEAANAFVLARRNKKHDYFTSCRPWPVKGGAEGTLPLTGLAAVQGFAIDDARTPTAGAPPASTTTSNVQATSTWAAYYAASTAATAYIQAAGTGAGADPLVFANLSTATGLALNAWRLAVASQQLLEKDSRGGTRYTELLMNHFGVRPEDSRLQRPEYIGGGKTRIETQAIPQTSATSGSNYLGQLAAQATAAGEHRFSCYGSEHGYIIGLVHVTADITYQQGLHRMWTRSTRYDFYWPVFANLGEQAVRNDELYCVGSSGGAQDASVFGYQERWAEYRHRPSRLTGYFRSDGATPLDTWHLAQEFGSLPTLNDTFMQDNPPMSRVLAAGSAADNQQVLLDSVFDIRCTRALPVYSVPGLARF